MSGEGVHRERQQVIWWVHLIVAIVLVGGILSMLGTVGDTRHPLLILALIAMVALIYGLLNPMTVVVGDEQMEVRFGQIGWPRWRFDLEQIEQARVVEFSPLVDYGGWGIRMRGGKLCFNQRGDTGVQFVHASREYVVGSDDPERLLDALKARGVATT